MEENQELLVNNEEEVTEMDSKMSGTTGAILGSVLTIAVIAGVNAFKKMASKRKQANESDSEAKTEEDTIDEHYDSDGNLK